jgi:hypothetical protein
MDAKEKTEAATWIAKALTYVVCVMPPVIVANITHWAATVITGKKMSLRAHLAVFLGSFGIAAAVHWLCQIWDAGRVEWLFIWSTSMATEQLLRFFYLEFGDMMKASVKAQIATLFKLKEKET